MNTSTAVGQVEFVNFLRIHPLFGIGMMLIVGYGLARLVRLVKLPEITGFILAGLIMGGGGLAVVGETAADDLAVITEVALGIIALTIGGELRIAKLKRIYQSVAWITVSQFLLTFVLVTLTLAFLSLPVPFALLLGAIATSTSPAAVVAVVQSSKARGRFIDQLYGAVALGDTITIAVFGVIMAMLPAMIGGVTDISDLIFQAISDFSVSVVLGAVVGFLIYVTTRSEHNTGEVLILTLGFLFLSTAMAVSFQLSPLLMNMAAGAALANFSAAGGRVFRTLEPFTPPIYALFFVIAGTKLNPTVLFSGEVLLLGGAFIVARWIGKYFGAFGGAVIGGSDLRARNWLGLGLFAHAGVALGLVLLLQAAPELDQIPALPPELVRTLINVVLVSVFVNEISGPPIAQFAIKRALKLEER